MGTHARRKVIVASTKRQLRTMRVQLAQLDLRVRDLESAIKTLFRITKVRH